MESLHVEPDQARASRTSEMSAQLSQRSYFSSQGRSSIFQSFATTGGSFAVQYEATEMKGTQLSLISDHTDEASSGPGAAPAVSAAIFNLANTIMGASLTGLPFVVSAGGIIPYILFMTFSVCIGYMTIGFLVESLPYVQGGKKDFQLVGVTAMGKTGSILTAAATWLSCYGALIAYFVLAGIQGPFLCKLVGMDPPPESWQVQIVIGVCVLMPLCMMTNISGLAPTSFVAIMVFALVACTAVYRFVVDDDFYRTHKFEGILDDPGKGVMWMPAEISWTSMGQFGTILMAFNCQYAFLPIVESFPNSRPADMKRVGLGGLLAAYVTYIVLGVCAYMTYQGHTEDMILLNFRHCHPECDGWTPGEADKGAITCPKEHELQSCIDDNPFINLLNGLFLFAVLMGYPCVHFACRKAQIAVTIGLDSEFSWPLHCGIGISNIAISLGIAVAVGSNVSTVFKWTGAVASPLLSFILPSAFYFSILGQNGVAWNDPKRLRVLAVFIYGVFIIGFCVSCNIMAEKK